MCRDLLRETRREQSKPGDGQTQGKQAEKQTTRMQGSKGYKIQSHKTKSVSKTEFLRSASKVFQYV